MSVENNNEEIVTLYDEDGTETDYVVVEAVEYSGKTYLALVEAACIEDEECEFIVLRMDEDEEGGVLSTIEDEKELTPLWKFLIPNLRKNTTLRLKTVSNKI